MLKNFFGLFKKIIFYVLLLYSFNLVAAPMGIIVPINLVTVISLVLLGVPALFSYILIIVLMFWGDLYVGWFYFWSGYCL